MSNYYNNNSNLMPREPRRRLFKAIFIDGSFLFHCAQNLNIRIDYKKLKQTLLNPGDHLCSAAYYTALPSEADIDDRHRSFLKILKREVRVRVRSVPLLKGGPSGGGGGPDSDGFGQRYSKGEDILLACDMVRGAYTNAYDVAVLVTGDGDFTPAVQSVQDAGKHVIVAAFKNSLSHALEMEATDIIYLDDHIEQIRLIDNSSYRARFSNNTTPPPTPTSPGGTDSE